jgi:hypothetical protein
MVFIKTKIVPPLKFCPKPNGTSHQHESNYIMCLTINFLLKKLFFQKEKEKFWGWLPPPWPDGGGSAYPKEPSGFEAPSTSPIKLGRKIMGKGDWGGVD